MTGPETGNDLADQTGVTPNNVRLLISSENLADMVEIALRLDGILITDDSDGEPGLIIAGPSDFFTLKQSGNTGSGHVRILVLISDEVDIPKDTEYLVVPFHADEYDLDPGLLIKKVREMLSGKRASATKNPVTNLPGAAAFESELRERISTGERFGVVFADLNQFKSYNKAYSYSHGDRMLQTVANLMLDLLENNPHPQNFLSHLGNDDFAIITSEKLAHPIAEKIVDSFDEMVAQFYDVSDLSRGTVIISDPRGNETEYPIVTITLAVILSSRNAFSHAAEAIDIAEDMLTYLKARDVTESCCIVERKDPD